METVNKVDIEIVKLIEKSDLAKTQDYHQAMAHLEEAHILSQPHAWPHFYVHWKMFSLAYEFSQRKEYLGQIPRLILAIPGSLTGRAPKGNVGSTRMGIFEEKK